MTQMDINEVMKHLPHRYPFLLVDRVLEFEVGKSLRAIKNVTINEPFFQGHFPHVPVMPGVLIMEALAQATGILSFKTTGNLPTAKSLYYFVGIDKARFRKPVEPGDQLILEVELERRIRDIWKFKGTASVNGEVVASANLMCAEKELES
ncbi:MAG: 3-hydroxyacyl-ACP dehydratase FabZ [Gammaproteobacteria bacterium]|uniref:3-hydroxyacyl-[acyl-carrier-protein] dehydratase FabZ n=1 Tax=Candidatus Thiopontia autotrophica TaxID=2841688 RepID=A0A8J6PBN9_9GAMM|nr:3-hydroxyacyl-ACP dehydratase FabZ [Candidatus Thiopontia autotrophica]MBL6968915.1 3-hydroxyacyl-ACP dehydratase FabZ [Gammaproteobacteria bacterium]